MTCEEIIRPQGGRNVINRGTGFPGANNIVVVYDYGVLFQSSIDSWTSNTCHVFPMKSALEISSGFI